MELATDTEPEVVSVDGEEFYQWKVVLRVPKNWTPESGVFIAVAPPGGIANFPAAIQGKPGRPPTLRNVEVIELEWDDPTPATAEWIQVSPGTDTAGPVYDEVRTQRKGSPGPSATLALLSAVDLDTTGAQAGYVFALKSDGEGGYDGAELVAQKVGNTYWPTAINAATNANGNTPLAQVAIPPQLSKCRLHVNGAVPVTNDGPDVMVDIVARLPAGDGTPGPTVIARGLGLAGTGQHINTFAAAPPPGSSVGYGELAAGGTGTVVHVRAEQIGSGLDTYDTDNTRAIISVDVIPLA